MNKKPNSKIKVNCPGCGRALRGATNEMLGDVGVCSKCRTEFIISKSKVKIKQKEKYYHKMDKESKATCSKYTCCNKSTNVDGNVETQINGAHVVKPQCIKCGTSNDGETYDIYVLEVTNLDIDLEKETTWFHQIGHETKFLCYLCGNDRILWIIGKPFLIFALIALWVIFVSLIMKIDVPKESDWIPVKIAIIGFGSMAACYFFLNGLPESLDSIGNIFSSKARRRSVEILVAEELAKKYSYKILGDDLLIGHKVVVTPGQLFYLQINAMRINSKQLKRKK